MASPRSVGVTSQFQEDEGAAAPAQPDQPPGRRGGGQQDPDREVQGQGPL